MPSENLDLKGIQAAEEKAKKEAEATAATGRNKYTIVPPMTDEMLEHEIERLKGSPSPDNQMLVAEYRKALGRNESEEPVEQAQAAESAVPFTTPGEPKSSFAPPAPSSHTPGSKVPNERSEKEKRTDGDQKRKSDPNDHGKWLRDTMEKHLGLPPGSTENLSEEHRQELLGGKGDPLRRDFAQLMETRGQEVWERYRRSLGGNAPSLEVLMQNPPLEDLFAFARREGLIGDKAADAAATSVQANAGSLVDILEEDFKTSVNDINLSGSLRGVFFTVRDRLKPIWASGRVAQLSPENVMLGLLEHGLKYKDEPAHVAGKLAVLSKVTTEDLNTLLGEGPWVQAVARNAERPSTVDAKLSLLLQRASRLASEISSDKIVSVRHLLTALLMPRTPGDRVGGWCNLPNEIFPAVEFAKTLIEHVRTEPHIRVTDDLTKWEEVFRPLEVALGIRKPETDEETASWTIGGATNFSREATLEEVALGAKEQAEVLRTFFAKAGTGELCFALFGHWGRGKTFLMQLLAQLLQKDGYKAVFFSAWKYPNAPEVWVHLYETLAEVACRGNPFQVLPRLIRTGIVRRGAWPLIGVLTSFAISLIPKVHTAIEALDLLKEVYLLIGLGGLIWLVLFVRGIQQTTKRLSKDYLTATRHTEKLGLQATIGTDLRSLLKGWMPQGHFKAGLPTVVYLVIVGVVSWSALYWFGFAAPHEVPEALRYRVSAGIGIIGLALLVWAFASWGAPKRVLLIIDDLDRCAPGQLLSVMESIKLLVENPEISKRVQVAMLVEEDILKQAILKKYRDINRLKFFTDERLVRENCEKLFTAHLRMPPLSSKDMENLFDKITGRERVSVESNELEMAKAGEASARDKLREIASARQNADIKLVKKPRLPGESDKDYWRRTSRDELGSFEEKQRTPTEKAAKVATLNKDEMETEREADKFRTTRENLEKKPGVRTPEPTESSGVPPGDNKFVFSEDEEDALRNVVPLLRSDQKDRPWGPRSIRAFVFRYQLARLLLIKMNAKWTPSQLAAELAKIAMSRTDADTQLVDEKVRSVVSQVS
jgi:hypothetical protein